MRRLNEQLINNFPLHFHSKIFILNRFSYPNDAIQYWGKIIGNINVDAFKDAYIHFNKSMRTELL
jgi:hypothetical protein